MRNLRLTVAYDGTDFHGFQIQRGTSQRTVQQLLMEGWHTLTGETIEVIGAGRTDAGVHALGQVVNFRTSHGSIPDERVPYALNSVLCDDVRITGCRRMPLAFHARFDAQAKVYEYRVYNDVFPSPLHRRYTYFVSKPLDVSAMVQAAVFFEGKQDFAAVSGHHDAVRTTVRTIFSCHVEKEGPIITFRLRGDGFLYNMVRTITGTLIMIGKGDRDPKWVQQLLASGNRAEAGPTAPACGLVLRSVEYPKE